MVGAGIYVLTGAVARNMAGPATALSFLLAGVTSTLAALCYAEFGTRIPRAGSAYAYTYVSIGEFWAFIIGWNIVLEYMIGELRYFGDETHKILESYFIRFITKSSFVPLTQTIEEQIVR